MTTFELAVFGGVLIVGSFFLVCFLTILAEALTYRIEGRRK